MSCSEFDFHSRTCSELKKGYDFTKSLTYKNSDKTAIDLTSLTFAMTIKDSLGGSILLSLAEVGDAITTGIYIPSPTTGVLNILITDTSSSSIVAGNYPYEITYTQANGLIFPFMIGKIQVTDRGF
jgi:hypothetical protein